MCCCVVTVWICGVETTHWFCSGFRMKEGLQQMSGEEGCKWGEGERRAVDVAVGKSDCKVPSPLWPIYVFHEAHPSLSSPSLPPSPFFSPLLPLCSLPSWLTPLFLSSSLSACQWLPCPLHALWLWLSSIHSPPPPLSLLHFISSPLTI